MPAIIHTQVLKALRKELTAHGITLSKKVWKKAHSAGTQCSHEVKAKIQGIKLPAVLWMDIQETRIVAGMLPRFPGKSVKTKLGLDYPEILIRNPQVSITKS
jgi:hypothetical protein